MTAPRLAGEVVIDPDQVHQNPAIHRMRKVCLRDSARGHNHPCRCLTVSDLSKSVSQTERHIVRVEVAR